MTSSFSIRGCVLKGCFERGTFFRAKPESLKGIENFNQSGTLVGPTTGSNSRRIVQRCISLLLLR